ncbi:MAG: GTPase HflX [Planctomycetota bacterium]|nr:MAG: GTPase HflX [Planctomycetota bacterium]
MARAPRSTHPPRERAVVAVLILPDSEAARASDPEAEIRGLAEAAGAEVVGGLWQRLRRPHPGTAFGRGKVAELAGLAREARADLVVVDFDLSPAQGRNLERELGLRVVDRTELILDIFARRARTRQARLQVELAQMEYLRPRLRRMWTHLERLEGAIGTRGPGETQLETDRRLIGRRIAELKQRLAEIAAGGRVRAEGRRDAVRLSLVGYTNAGKSSLMNALTGAGVLVADQLFATLDTRVRRWPLGDGREVLLADTVGFVRDLPHHLVASFHATLEETLNADLLLHVCDATDPELDTHLRAVEEVLARLGADRIPVLRILNKADRLGDRERRTALLGHPDALLVSAVTGEGLDRLAARVGEVLDHWSLLLELQVPAGEGRLLAEIRRAGRIEAETWADGDWCGRVRIEPRLWPPLQTRLIAAGGRWRTG